LSFPPSNAAAAQRPFFLAKYLKEFNYEVIVLTSEIHYSSLGSSDWAVLSDINIVRTKNFDFSLIHKSRKRKNVETQKSNILLYSLKRIIRILSSFFINNILPKILIPDKGLFWRFFALKPAFEIMRELQPDIIFSTSPSVINHLIARKITKKFNVKWVADFRDCYYTCNIEFTKGFRKILDRHIERLIVESTDHTSFISQTMMNYYVAKYPNLKVKSSCIYNGFDEEEFSFENEVILSNRKLRIFYAGSFYNGLRNPVPLLKTLDRLIGEELIDVDEFEIEIAGFFDENLKKEIEVFKSFANISFLGTIPRKEVIQKYRDSHLLWLIIGEHLSHRIGFPVKGYEYIGSKRPIIVFANEPAECYNIIEQLDCGVVLKNDIDDKTLQNNADHILSYFSMFRNSELNKCIEYSDKPIQKYIRKNQTNQFADLFTKLLDD
jgi:glycosyltransferase involved in cell wall biosynthesis